MKLKTIDFYDFKGKKVLVRADLNSPVKNGKVLMNDRIRESVRTLKELKKKRAKVIAILAHQSRPGKKDFISLEQHAKLLNKFVKVSFVKNKVPLTLLREGEIFLMENVRMNKEEFKPSLNNKMVREFKDFDIYVNDAFSVCHRNQTSVMSFPKVMKSCVGRLMEKELKALEKLRVKNTLFILGGTKAEENLTLLEEVTTSPANGILACGIFGQLCLIAKGHNLGAQNIFLKKELKIVPQLKKFVKNVSTPFDLAVKINEKRKELSVVEFPSRHEVFDIGEETISDYVHEIKKAKALFMKGTAGYYEEKQFRKGTERLLKAIASSEAYSVLGGGHLTSAMSRLQINKKRFDHVSLGGGALAMHIAGKKLPGLEALKRGK